MPFKKVDAIKELDEHLKETGKTKEQFEQEIEEYRKREERTYQIPVVFSMIGHVEVKAHSLQEAIDIVNTDPSISLPENASYLEDSFQVDESNDFLQEALNRVNKR